jgi:DNA repair exonuclease SbcCD nuclease subunit
MLAFHPGIHVFDRPRTFTVDIRGVRLALIGFPYYRNDVRSAFLDLLNATDWVDADADVNLLCVHHCFEGASVGPSNYTFRHTPDVIRLAEVPNCMAAVLSGHIHRHQVLTKDLAGDPLETPVLYPGSIERTSFAEMAENKGYLMLEVARGNSGGGILRHWEFVELPARPMFIHDLSVANEDGRKLESRIRRVIGETPVDAVLKIRIHGRLTGHQRAAARAANLREMAPDTINVEAVLVDERPRDRS